MSRVHGKKIIRRRKNIEKKSIYSAYKSDLKTDFYNTCGYCGKERKVSKSNFEIDHLIPYEYAPDRRLDYTNLVYCCFQCNRKKGKKWKKPCGNAGFIDPASDEYDNHLKRESCGRIIALSDTGKYMLEAFKFDLRPMSEIWQTMKLYEKVEFLRKNDKEPSQEDIDILSILNDIFKNQEMFSEVNE